MVNYWLEKGLGGFRVDAISHIKKDFSYVNLPADGPDGLVDAWEYYKNTTGIEVFLNELRIANCRLDFLHKLSLRLISENQVICLENLKVKNMLKNSTLSKSISDVSWSKFRQLLEYKAKWYGRIVSIIDTYYPSSQLCSNCGFKNEEVKNLNIRAWECPNCKTKHHRDINSAINIKRVGLVQSDFKPVEIVGYEVFETGSSYF